MKTKTYKLEIHYDERGWLAEILRVDRIEQKISQIYVSYSVKGIVRGGHYHKRKTEWFFVINGEASFYLRDLNTGEENDLQITAEDHMLVEIPPGVFHTIKSKTELYLVVASSEVFDKNDSDTYVD
ncbi:WxcM-like domain-containing protein [Caldisericum sp.]|uniref:polysaccharide biosynthesis C-terminal domain-containing protein n=1 Tax=Caldisericum sp. TaxID=2499687 RepID=UPI003D119697